MSALDPRAQLALLFAAVAGTLFLGTAGLIGGALAAAALVVSSGSALAWLRLMRAIVPLALVIVLLDLVGGSPAQGIRTAARLLVLASLGHGFAQAADGERLIAGLRALRVPYAITFILVAGARFIPTTWADVTQLRDAARLRGIVLEGPPWRQLAGWRLLLVPLLVTTVRRGMQLGEAMEARAFGAAPSRTVRRPLAWRPRDTVALLAGAVYVIAVAVAGVALG